MPAPSATLVITTFERDHLLELTLPSINREDLEIIVVNDSIPGNTETLCRRHGVRYLYTGKDTTQWHGPALAINMGVAAARGEFVFISCAEIFHIDDEVMPVLIQLLLRNPQTMAIPTGKQDVTGLFLKRLSQGESCSNMWDGLHRLKVELPFLLGLDKATFVAIGGYDEDFLKGRAFDDNDFVDRLTLLGYQYLQSPQRIVHLYHERNAYGRIEGIDEAWNRNKALYEARKGTIVRNPGKVW